MKNSDKHETEEQKKEGGDSNGVESRQNEEAETNPGIWTEEELKKVPYCEGKWF